MMSNRSPQATPSRTRPGRLALAIIAAGVVLGTSACVSTSQPASRPFATATIRNADGAVIGTARLSPSGSAASLTVEAGTLPAGPHGIHLHAVGRCEAPGFTSAGGHLNPAQRQHGHENPQGSHLGDLPNLVVGADGNGVLSAPLAGDGAAVEASLFDGDGAAIVIHAGPDDYRTDPSGNSGARLACGVFERVS